MSGYVSQIAFDQFHVPVPARLINRMMAFKDGMLSVEGVRISVIATTAYFHVLSWEDLAILHRLNIDLGDYLSKIRAANPNWEQRLFIRRVQYSSKKIRAKQKENLRG